MPEQSGKGDVIIKMHDFLKENIKIKYKRKEILAVLMELDYIL